MVSIHIEVQARPGCVVATSPDMPGCQGIGHDREAAVARLERVIAAYIERPPPSPFASVQKRLAERSAGI
jgi:predicted RNase H-like HicB family nuclease